MTNVGSAGGTSAQDQSKNNRVGFKILNEEDGKPVDHAHVKIKLSDGSTRSKKTFDTGEVWFNHIPSGSCDLEECVKVYALLEKKNDYTLKNKDTLHSLAEKETKKDNAITWDDIAAFNWGETARYREVCNEFMRDDLGCFTYDNILGDMAYSGGGTSDSIEIPKKVARQGLGLDTQHEIKVRIRQTPPQFLCCGGIPNITFQHADSFIRPNADKYLAKLKEEVKKHPDAKLMIFGHTDKVGDETVNKLLSERRAKSAFALVTKKPDYWVTLYKYSQNNPENEDWGVTSVQTILNYLNPKARLDLSNILDDRTIKEIEIISRPAFEDTHFGKKIPESTLKKIFQAYFDKLMEGSSITESDFLELKHAGCSEFNPILEIDQEEEDNRRASFFLFDSKRLPKPPCSNTDIEPCKKQCTQFNKNKTTYRNKKTFACTFYDSIARDCDAEVVYPDVIAIDAHMHFMSGHCTPMPLLWNQVPGKPKVRRSIMDNLGGAALQYSISPLKLPVISGLIRGTRMQRRSTMEIADIGIAQNNTIYEKVYKKLKRRKLDLKMLTPMIPMPMDMSYAHIDGYDGVPIYQRVTKRKYFKYEIKVHQTSFHSNQELQTVRIDIWPDDVCQGRDDLMSEANAKKKFGKYIVIKEEGFGKGNKKEGFYYFWARKSQLDDTDITFLEQFNAQGDHEKREPIWLHAQEMDLFVDWPAQKEDTLAAAIKNPFRYMPMYHYEPRRWSALDNDKQPETDRYDPVLNWEEPFSDIATPGKAGAFVGFKMYTALGYKPLDQKLEKTLNKFYDRCQNEEIPIMCHCSPSGMFSHDRELYFMRESGEFQKKYSKMKWGIKFWKKYRNYKEAIGFYDEFVRPSAWRDQVMKEFPELRLCLAHFGGGSSEWEDWSHEYNSKVIRMENAYQQTEMRVTKKQKEQFLSDWYMFDAKKDYNPNSKRWIREMVEMLEEYDNFYTDISFHFVENHKAQLAWILKKHPNIRNKIMFGTDWYMTELDNWSIEKYVKRVKDSLDDLSKDLEKETGIRDDLFLKFSRINPMTFYKIRSIADKFEEGLKKGVKMLNEKPVQKESLGNASQQRKKIELNDKELNNNRTIITNSDLY